jgi:hypothetical protein
MSEKKFSMYDIYEGKENWSYYTPHDKLSKVMNDKNPRIDNVISKETVYLVIDTDMAELKPVLIEIEKPVTYRKVIRAILIFSSQKLDEKDFNLLKVNHDTDVNGSKLKRNSMYMDLIDEGYLLEGFTLCGNKLFPRYGN